MKLKIVKSGGFQGMLVEKEIDIHEIKEDDQKTLIDFVNKKKGATGPTVPVPDQFQYQLTIGTEEVNFGEFDLEPDDQSAYQKIEDILRS